MVRQSKVVISGSLAYSIIGFLSVAGRNRIEPACEHNHKKYGADAVCQPYRCAPVLIRHFIQHSQTIYFTVYGSTPQEKSWTVRQRNVREVEMLKSA